MPPAICLLKKTLFNVVTFDVHFFKGVLMLALEHKQLTRLCSS